MGKILKLDKHGINVGERTLIDKVNEIIDTVNEQDGMFDKIISMLEETTNQMKADADLLEGLRNGVKKVGEAQQEFLEKQKEFFRKLWGKRMQGRMGNG